MSVVKQLTLNGAGIGLLSETVVKAEKKEGSLVQVLPKMNYKDFCGQVIDKPRQPLFPPRLESIGRV